MALSFNQPLLVLDTNTVVRGIFNWESPSGVILEALERREFPLLLSKAVFSEYRKVLNYPDILARHSESAVSAEKVLRRLRYVSEFKGFVGVKFAYERDPDDEKFLELAIVGRATHLVTHDRDLLVLADGHSVVAKDFRRRLPGIRILKPQDFLASVRRFPMNLN